jgi:hypothetical protein
MDKIFSHNEEIGAKGHFSRWPIQIVKLYLHGNYIAAEELSKSSLFYVAVYSR